MRKPCLLLFSLLSLISCPVTFADDALVWYPYPDSDTVEEPEWIIFGALVFIGIVISDGIYYRRKNAKKQETPPPGRGCILHRNNRSQTGVYLGCSEIID